MTGDGECPHCRAPWPIAGLPLHASDCPRETGVPRPAPLDRETLVRLARACEWGWDALRERAKASAA